MTSKDTRKPLLHAAVIDLLAREGLKGVTHRAVDTAAGLPQGTASYHYPRKSALLLAAAEHLEALLSADCAEMQIGFAREVSRDGLEAGLAFVGAEVLRYTDGARAHYLARLELTLAGRRDPALEGIGDRLSAATRRPIVFFLELNFNESSPAQVETCAGLIDGIMLMHATGQGPQPTAGQIRAVFRALD